MVGFVSLIVIATVIFLFGYDFGERAERARWLEKNKDDIKSSDDKR